MAQACLSEGKVVAPALKFFIDPNNLNPEEDEEVWLFCSFNFFL